MSKLPLNLEWPLLILVGWLAGGRSSLRAAGLDLDFSRPAPEREWSATHQVSPPRFSTSGLEVDLQGDDPYLTSPLFPFGGTQEWTAEVRLWSESGGKGQLFWYAGNAREQDSVHFDAPAGRWIDVTLPLPPLENRTRLRLDPPGTNGLFKLAWIRINPMGSRGITKVVGESNHITVTVGNVAGAFQVVGIPPYAGLEALAAGRIVAEVAATGSREIRLGRYDDEGGLHHDRITDGFVIREPDGAGGFRPVGPIRSVEEFREVGRNHPQGQPSPGKKGLQVQMVEDAIALGVKQAALNVNLAGLVDPAGAPDSYVWRQDGKNFHFRKAGVDAIPVKRLSEAGAAVTFIVLAYESGNPVVDRILLHPKYSPGAPNHLGAFNTVTPEGADWFAASLGFLAARFSDPLGTNGRVANFIIGNEVTAHWYWYNEGDLPPDQLAADYARTVRLANATVQRETDSIRVYLSFDHHWNLVYGGNPNRAIAGRQLLGEFNRAAEMGGNFDWHIAYHPYAENLGNPRTWEDRTAWPGPDTPRITFRNLEVLTTYLQRPELMRLGRPRRVILSEQGFHSDGTDRGEQLQAAAYAYAWEKVKGLEGIDAFIYHRHVDHQLEGGLNLGLWRRKPAAIADPDVPKPIYRVFKAADTPEEENAFQFALPLIGITNWTQIHAH